MSENTFLIDKSTLSNLPIPKLMELYNNLNNEKKRRYNLYIKPIEKQYLDPLKNEHIKPAKEKYLKEVNDVLKEIRKLLPKKNDEKVILEIDGKKFGPLTRKQFSDMMINVYPKKQI